MSEQPSIVDARELAAFGQLGRNTIVFGRVLHALGFGAQPDRLVLLAQALDEIGLRSRDDVKAAARAVLVRTAEEAHRFDAVFDAFWSALGTRSLAPPQPEESHPEDMPGRPSERPTEQPKAPMFASNRASRADRAAADASRAQRAQPVEGDRSFTYSFAEGIYQKELSQLSDAEAEQARELVSRRLWELATRRSRRTTRGGDDARIDYRATLRGSLRRGGEVVKLVTRSRKRKQRDLVLLCDVSGSMDRYSRLLLQFVHTVRQSLGRVEAFVFGTRLTRITREIRHRDIRAALDDVSANVTDWAGGTRIGECLRDFNLHWAPRVLGRGAIVIIISDGWDRGDIGLLAAEMRRLQRSAYRLIWLNPLLGSSRYRPKTVGMQAALPYIDDFLPAHNLRSLMQLAELLREVEDRRPMRAQRPAS